MVVVARAAEPVTRLSGRVHELVDDVLLTQDRQRAIDRRQADPLALLPEACVDLLGGGVVRLGSERREHEQPLPRGPDACPDEALEELR